MKGKSVLEDMLTPLLQAAMALKEESRCIYFWVVVSNVFYFHPYLGKIPILTNIFQMG